MKMTTLLLGIALVAMPAMAMAQQAQVTNDDLLRLIGLQQVQNLQIGKALEACAQEVVKLKETKTDAPPSSPK